MMQYLRTVDWSKVPEVHSPVYDGHKLYEVYARLQARGEQVTVPAGNFSALKIELRVLDNGAEMKDAHFVLYLTDTEARTAGATGSGDAVCGGASGTGEGAVAYVSDLRKHQNANDRRL